MRIYRVKNWDTRVDPAPDSVTAYQAGHMYVDLDCVQAIVEGPETNTATGFRTWNILLSGSPRGVRLLPENAQDLVTEWGFAVRTLPPQKVAIVFGRSAEEP